MVAKTPGMPIRSSGSIGSRIRARPAPRRSTWSTTRLGRSSSAERVGEIGVHSIFPIEVPLRPGPYTAEVWLRSASGEGPRTSAILRFDNARPSAARPIRPDAWVPAAKPATIEIAPATGAQPISGIRGYAVSVDRRPEGSPCAGPDRCSVAETDLRSGAGGGTISVGFLPEGINFAHVVAVSGSGMRSQTRRNRRAGGRRPATRSRPRGGARRLVERPGSADRDRHRLSVGDDARRPRGTVHGDRDRRGGAGRRRRRLGIDDGARGRRPPGRVLRAGCRRQRRRRPGLVGPTLVRRGADRRSAAADRLREVPGPSRTGADRGDGHRPTLGAWFGPGLDRGSTVRNPAAVRTDPDRCLRPEG